MSTEINMSVNIAGVEWKNPVTVASGTFGSGAEFEEFVDLNRLGAVTTKGVANIPWAGNPTPRVAETCGGMMNAVGLQNPGIDLFCKRDIPFLKKYDTRIIVNVCGKSTEDYCEVVERLAEEDVDMLELFLILFHNPFILQIDHCSVSISQFLPYLSHLQNHISSYMLQFHPRFPSLLPDCGSLQFLPRQHLPRQVSFQRHPLHLRSLPYR